MCRLENRHQSVSNNFKCLKHFVSCGETLCFIAWNTLFQGMKHIVSTVETSRETTGRISPSYKRMLFDIIPSVDEADVLQTVPP